MSIVNSVLGTAVAPMAPVIGKIARSRGIQRISERIAAVAMAGDEPVSDPGPSGTGSAAARAAPVPPGSPWAPTGPRTSSRPRRPSREHRAPTAAAARADETSAGRVYFDLFSGLGREALLPYASHYLTGSLYGRPLARLRETFRNLGIERAAGHSEPEDHVAILCEIMAGLVGGEIAGPPGADRGFFESHLGPWIRRFFVDLEGAGSADFYARVGSLGRIFIDIETEAFVLPA